MHKYYILCWKQEEILKFIFGRKLFLRRYPLYSVNCMREGAPSVLVYFISIMLSTMLCTQKRTTITEFRLTEIRTLKSFNKFPILHIFFLLLVKSWGVINRIFNCYNLTNQKVAITIFIISRGSSWLWLVRTNSGRKS